MVRRPTRPADRCGTTRRLSGPCASRPDPAVDAAEAQRLVPDVELVQAGQAGAHHDVALGPGLERTSPTQVQYGPQHGDAASRCMASSRRRPDRGTAAPPRAPDASATRSLFSPRRRPDRRRPMIRSSLERDGECRVSHPGHRAGPVGGSGAPLVAPVDCGGGTSPTGGRLVRRPRRARTGTRRRPKGPGADVTGDGVPNECAAQLEGRARLGRR